MYIKLRKVFVHTLLNHPVHILFFVLIFFTRVPPLQFKGLVSELSEENILNKPLLKSKVPKSPSSQSPVSWGTPLDPPYILTKKDIEVGGTVFRPCTHLQHGGNRNLQQRNVCFILDLFYKFYFFQFLNNIKQLICF